MLSARKLLHEITDHDEAFRLLCSLAVGGTAPGEPDSRRIADLLPEGRRDLAPLLARSAAERERRARRFAALLRERGLESLPLPQDADYVALLKRQGVGPVRRMPTGHGRSGGDDPLTERDLIACLARLRITGQRVTELLALLEKYADRRPELREAVRALSQDRAGHLARCQEALLCLSGNGHAAAVERRLRDTATAEIRVFRDVCLAVVARLALLLGWSRAKTSLLAGLVQAVYVAERLSGRRRTADLRSARRSAGAGTGIGTEAAIGGASAPEAGAGTAAEAGPADRAQGCAGCEAASEEAPAVVEEVFPPAVALPAGEATESTDPADAAATASRGA